jgi:hypothetical protein
VGFLLLSLVGVEAVRLTALVGIGLTASADLPSFMMDRRGGMTPEASQLSLAQMM